VGGPGVVELGWNQDDSLDGLPLFAFSFKSSCRGVKIPPSDADVRGHSNMAPMKKLARSLKERIDNVVTYCTYGITNAVAEGINSKIMSIKRRAGGYHNIENFKTAVLFYCGALDLDPR
jgi:hypothetical protein